VRSISGLTPVRRSSVERAPKRRVRDSRRRTEDGGRLPADIAYQKKPKAWVIDRYPVRSPRPQRPIGLAAPTHARSSGTKIVRHRLVMGHLREGEPRHASLFIQYCHS
jgi:hypothetical protein